MKRRMLALLLVLVLSTSCSIALAEDYDFGPVHIGTGGFMTLATAGSQDTTWVLRLTTLYDGPAVGVVFLSNTSDWASALWVFSSTGTYEKPYKEAYQNQPMLIDWRMRKDNDYSGRVTVAGTFTP